MVCKKLGIWISGFLNLNCGEYALIKSSIDNVNI